MIGNNLRHSSEKRLLSVLIAFLVLAGALLAVPTPIAYAATITVDSLSETSSGGICTLRDAIIAANTNAIRFGCGAGSVGADIINFSLDGAIVLTGTLPTITQDLTINGTGHNVSISGNDAVRIFNISSTVAFKLYNLTLRDGRGNPNAGAILNNSGTVAISNTIFMTNTTPTGGNGGAIVNTGGGTSNIYSSTFSYNSADIGGGAIYLPNGTLNLTTTTFFSNTSPGIGGAIRTDNNSAINITGASFLTNTADSGGGLYVFNAYANISGTTLMGNSATTSGGGIRTYAAILTMTNSALTNNQAYVSNNSAGAGIHDYQSILNITNSIISLNLAPLGFSGGIHSDFGVITLTNTSVLTNTATGSGGINASGGRLNLVKSIVSGNTATSQGGGGITNAGILTLTNSTVNGNSAAGFAGGIFNSCSYTMTIDSSTISNNTANDTSVGGGGVYNCGPTTMTNTTISGNKIKSSGGGIDNIGGSATLNLNNVTIFGNAADSDNTGGGVGGGIINSGGTVNFKNTIIAGNTDDGTAPDCFGNYNSQDYNLVLATTGCTIGGTTTHNVPAGQDPKLAPLANWGGPTKTHGLFIGSPALDKIPFLLNGCGTAPTTDQRGTLRPQNSLCDIGAFEGFLYPLYLPLILK